MVVGYDVNWNAWQVEARWSKLQARKERSLGSATGRNQCRTGLQHGMLCERCPRCVHYPTTLLTVLPWLLSVPPMGSAIAALEAVTSTGIAPAACAGACNAAATAALSAPMAFIAEVVAVFDHFAARLRWIRFPLGCQFLSSQFGPIGLGERQHAGSNADAQWRDEPRPLSIRDPNARHAQLSPQSFGNQSCVKTRNRRCFGTSPLMRISRFAIGTESGINCRRG